MTDYTLTRSNRKTMSIQIKNGNVEVRSPLRLSKAEIDKFVKSKEKWITDNLAKSTALKERRENFTLNYCDKILYHGIEYPIIAKAGNRIGFDDTYFYIPLDLDSEQIKQACIQIYKKLAKRDCTRKVMHFAKQMNVMPIAVKINSAKTRWGSCSAKKSLNFSWRLILADDDVIDYVVVHELAHITEMNHSARFWAIVENILPDYKQHQERLKTISQKLSAEDWEK